MTRYDMADAMRNVITEQREDITALKAEVAKLQDENAKLLDEMIDAYNDKVVAQLEADNAKLFALLKHESEQAEKLRELMRIAVKYCDSGTCDGCTIMGEDEICPYYDMARELGVEVDDG